MNDIYVPESYIQNQIRLQGDSLNLQDANTLQEYLYEKEDQRSRRDDLELDIINIITHIPKLHALVDYYNEEIKGIDTADLQKLLNKLNYQISRRQDKKDIVKIKLIQEYL